MQRDRGVFVRDERDLSVFTTCDCPCNGGRNSSGHRLYQKHETGRRLSFPKHSLPCYDQFCIEDLSAYGFVWKFDGSRLGSVKCVYCKVLINDYDASKLAALEHFAKSPNCQLMRGDAVENVRAANISDVPDPDVKIIELREPSCPPPSPYDRDEWKYRYNSFNHSWTQVMGHQELANYGFIWSGERDGALCEYCGLTIKTWKKNDLAAVEHKRYSPDCPFMNWIANN